MELLMISHLLGDFYFQTDNISEKKKSSLKYLLLHVVLYMTSIYCCVILATGKWKDYICAILIIGACHTIIDWVKIKLENTYEGMAKYKLLALTVDQMLHIIILWLFKQEFLFEMDLGWIPGISICLSNQMNEILIVIIAVLLCGKPSAIFVALVFERIPRTVYNAEKTGSESNTLNHSESLKIGSWVGILEREIILILGLLGQYGAIGFVLAAKSLARHNQLNNPAFAEKYLVGTLLSSLIALLSIVMCEGLK